MATTMITAVRMSQREPGERRVAIAFDPLVDPCAIGAAGVVLRSQMRRDIPRWAHNLERRHRLGRDDHGAGSRARRGVAAVRCSRLLDDATFHQHDTATRWVRPQQGGGLLVDPVCDERSAIAMSPQPAEHAAARGSEVGNVPTAR